ncbi:hypothetical protein J3F83DRAFT_713774 [Trichoderma novae-zelandiae]
MSRIPPPLPTSHKSMYVVLRTAADPLAPDSEPASGTFDRGHDGSKGARAWQMSLSGVGFHFFVDDPDAGYWLVFTMWHWALAAEHQLPPSLPPLQMRGAKCVGTAKHTRQQARRFEMGKTKGSSKPRRMAGMALTMPQ